MDIASAYKTANRLQMSFNDKVVNVTYKNYSGYQIEIEPVELTIIKNSLGLLNSANKGFFGNIKEKYGK